MKRFSDIILEQKELLEIKHRLNEINELLDLELDDDIHDNLVDELEEIKAKLIKSIKTIKIKELGLMVV